MGYGFDYRYETRNIVGSVLMHKEEVLHAAFFKVEDHQSHSNMSGARRRA
jgi:hypothetical protein